MRGPFLLTIGNELLSGRIVNTNAAWLSRTLTDAGFHLVGQVTVGDDPDDIRSALDTALARSSIVIVGGGLGPTADDLTRAALAAATERPLVRCSQAAELLRAFFEKHGRELPERELVQADLPKGAEPLPNPLGTAPGFVLDLGDDRLLFALPGVPSELKRMTDEQVLLRLSDHPSRGTPPVSRSLTVAGLPESIVAEKLADLLVRGRNPELGSYPQIARVVVVVRGQGAEAASLVDRDMTEIRARLGEHVVGEGDLELNVVAGEALIANGRTLALAESLTGGLITDGLVKVPGISRVLLAGLTTYANAAKIGLLGVPAAVLENQGAVSEACAQEMALGARRATGADLGLSVPGPGPPRHCRRE